jgi:hypothetical protein
MAATDSEILTATLVRLVRDIVAALGHDPDDDSVEQVITGAMGRAHQFLVIQQYERDVTSGRQ